MGGVGLALPDQTGARVARASPCALRVGFLSPSRAGGVVRSEFPGVRGGRVPGGRGVAVVAAAAAAAGGSRLSLGSGVGDGGVEAAASARLSVSRR